MSRLWRPSRSLDTVTPSHDPVGRLAYGLASPATPRGGSR